MILNNKNRSELMERGIDVPLYDRTKLAHNLVHIGLGHFHRAHFLTYVDTLLRNGQETSGVFEVDLIPSSPSFIDNLTSQDYLYSVLGLSSDGRKELRVNGPIWGYANQTTHPEKVSEVLEDSKTQLITLTITEKGYFYKEDTQSLDWNNLEIIHDLLSLESPKTAVGCLSQALSRRYRSKTPVTIMSCDNVPENGTILRRCILQFCEKKYPEIVSWIEEEIAFPCTMVDRITPGTTEKDLQLIHDVYGIEDGCAVHCEDYIQWVIEDKKSSRIPDFAKAGALIVDDVKPYELMKIRLLNGSHSALSYPAYMMGITAVHDAVNHPVVREFIRNQYMEQIVHTLDPVPGIDLKQYMDKLISRFSNKNIADTVLRLASDGSKKIYNAIIKPLEEGRRKQKAVGALVLALSLWEHYFICKDPDGNPMPIDDPKKEELVSLCHNPKNFLLAVGLDPEIAMDDSLIDEIKSNLQKLAEEGVEATLRGYSWKRN